MSSVSSGTPGENDSTVFSGEPAADDNRNGISNLIGYAVGSEIAPGFVSVGEDMYSSIPFRRNLIADDALVVVESSDDLASWSALPIQHSATSGGDGTMSVTWRMLMPSGGATSRQFLRICVTTR